MKKPILLLITLIACAFSAYAQKSPKKEAAGTFEGVDVKVVYHSPSARGRTVMGELVPYGKVWRTGANNATTIEIGEDLVIEGEELKAGRYGLFSIPGENTWTIIFNGTPDQWGAFNYDEGEDILRVEVETKSSTEFFESLDISVVGEGVRITWENTSVLFSISK